MTTLGRLELVDLRSVWTTEDRDFTPWLAREENLEILGDTIGMELELEAQEKDVGPFRADLLCKDTATDDWDLIENQLEGTDHKHLGQLLTYAAGLHAVTIVWLANSFSEEHRATLDWLNEITDDRFRFFGLKIELWRIGDSLAAPKFSIISKPNDWRKAVGQASRRLEAEAMTDSERLYLRYWTAFRGYLTEHTQSLRVKTPRPRGWTRFSIGRSGVQLDAVVSPQKQRLAAGLYMRDDHAKAYFHLLQADQAAIEQAFGCALNWQELPEKRASRIVIYKEDTDPTDEADWPNQHAWLVDMLQRLDTTFRERVRQLDPADWQPEEDEAAE